METETGWREKKSNRCVSYGFNRVFQFGFFFYANECFFKSVRGDGFWGLTFLKDEFLGKESFLYYPVLVLVNRRSVRWINSEKYLLLFFFICQMLTSTLLMSN